MKQSALSFALAFARHGHPVLPLTWPMRVNDRLRCSCKKATDCPTPAKHPLGRLVPNGLLDATTDQAIIKIWFTSEPAANLGVRADGLVVIDVDPRHDGDESLRALERQYGELPPTWRTLTGGGGEHVIFKSPGGVTVHCSEAHTKPVLGPGIDVRAARGGYIAVPPSRHIRGGAYAFSVDHHPGDLALAEAPDWLLQKLTTPGETADIPMPRPAEEWLKLTRQPVIEYRDCACARFAGYLVYHLDPVVAFDVLNWWNERNCQPPLDDAEVHRIWRRIVHRHAERLNAQGAANA